MPKLRRFLYLDDEIVGQFLAQVEGGEFDEQRITDQQSSSSGIGGSFSAGPASARADRGRSGSSQAETVLRQSGPSRFNRLHLILQTEHELSSLNAADDKIWEDLEVGETIEAVVTLEVPEFFQTMDQMSGLAEISPLLDARLAGLLPLTSIWTCHPRTLSRWPISRKPCQLSKAFLPLLQRLRFLS